MHPPLALHLHPMCEIVIKKLEECHKEHSLTKFLGKCNQARLELDSCLTEEVTIKHICNMHNLLTD
jgi:COX assembly protein 2